MEKVYNLTYRQLTYRNSEKTKKRKRSREAELTLSFKRIIKYGAHKTRFKECLIDFQGQI